MRDFDFPRRTGVVGLLVAAACGISTNAMATDFSQSPYLFGGWNGERQKLADKGIDFTFSYTNEAAHNLTGGTHETTRAASQLAAEAVLDLDKLWGFRHTTFDFVMTDRFGRSLDADAGLNTSQNTQEIYGRGQTVWLTRLVLQRTFFEKRLTVKVGRDNEATDFDAAECDFQNLTFCGAQGPNLYGNYWMSWPGSVWMAHAKVQATSSTAVMFGVYQQSPTYYNATWEGRNAWSPLSPNGTDGVVLPLEVDVATHFWGKEGTYRVGAMYTTSGQPDITEDINGGQRAVTGLPARQTGGSYNGYVSITQRLTGPNGGEGLIGALRGVVGDRASSVDDRQMTATLTYENPWHRVGDKFGIGFGATHTSSRQAEYQAAYNALHPGDATNVADGYEYTSEMFYHWQATKAISLQPGVQYILHPGGTAKNPNIVIVGVKSFVTF